MNLRELLTELDAAEAECRTVELARDERQASERATAKWRARDGVNEAISTLLERGPHSLVDETGVVIYIRAIDVTVGWVAYRVASGTD